MKFFSLLKMQAILCLLAIFLWQPLQGNSLTNTYQTRQVTEVLEEISEHYQVFFSYETKLLRELKVDFNFKKSESLDENMSRLFQKVNLQFKTIGSKYYVIFKPSKQGKKSARKLERKIRQINKLESKSGINLQQVSGKKSRQLKDITNTIIQLKKETPISGKVLDAKTQEPLIGVNILIDGTSTGTVTDFDGNYSIDASPTDVLVFSYTGYTDQKIKIGNQTSIEVQLYANTALLDEVVVIGYGVAKKSDLTGSVSSISTEQLRRAPVATVGQSLQGLAAGVTVTGRSGSPGAEATIKVRGFGTINDSNPYVIIDGAPGNLNNLNSADIESIEILKDASATAIYGSNGANGVILVTTKKGKNGKPKISFDTYVGSQKAWRGLDVLTAPEWAMLVNEGRANDGAAPEFANPNSLDTYDWGNLVYRTGMIQNHQISASGGNDFMTYFLSYGYTDQEGIIRNSDFNRHNLRLNNTYKINDNVSVGHLLTYSRSFQSTVAESSRWLWDHTAIQGYGWEPHIPFYDANGGFSAPERVNAIHPEAELLFEDNQSVNRNFGANIYIDVNLFNDFTFRSTYAAGFGTNEVYDFDEVVPGGYANNGGILRAQNELTARNNRSTGYTWSNVLSYSKSFDGVHNITALIGHEQQESEFVGATAIGREIDGLFGDPIINNTANRDGSGGRSETALLSYFSRATYNYDDRYLLTGTIRRDGSSKFGPNNQWGVFPSVGGAWNVHNESFWNKGGALNRMKVRGGWGQIGNRNFPNFGFFSQLSLGPTSGVDVVFGDNRASGAASKGASNPNLKWESTTTANVGVDLGFFDDKITFSVDYFNRNTTDMIINISAPTQTSGLTDRTRFNIGAMNNKGWEVSLGYNTRIGELGMRIVGNIDRIKNELTELNTDNAFIAVGDAFGQNGFMRSEPGRSLSSFYGLQTDGLFQTQAEVDGGNQPNAMPGDIRYVDQNNDGVIDAADRTWIGSPFPDFNYSMNVALDFKGFDVGIFFQGIQGNEIFSSMPYFFENELASGLTRSALDRWTGPGTSTTVPRATFEGAAANIIPSDRFVYDGSYLRLKNLTIGYTLPSASLERAGIERLRFYANAQNLLTFTKYDIGLDPEIGQAANEGSQLYIGQDRGTYPQPRAITFGLNLTF